MPSSRDRLRSLIRPMLPPKWQGRIEPHTVKSIGTLGGPAVFIDFTTMSGQGMPPGQLVDGFDLALVSHLTDYSKAEDALDATARQLVRALDTSTEVAWSDARKASVGDYLAWIITVQLITPDTEE